MKNAEFLFYKGQNDIHALRDDIFVFEEGEILSSRLIPKHPNNVLEGYKKWLPDLRCFTKNIIKSSTKITKEQAFKLLGKDFPEFFKT